MIRGAARLRHFLNRPKVRGARVDKQGVSRLIHHIEKTRRVDRGCIGACLHP
jgi:hypothetical protein